MADFKFIGGIKILLISAAVASILIAIGIISQDLGIVGNAVIIAVIIVAVPQFLIRYETYRTLKEMEDRLPLLLRDIIESLRSGMPLHIAIRMASGIDYGRLSKEVKKMNDQLSWGVTVDKVLEQFADRVRESRRLFTALKVLREAKMSGGDLVATLESIAENSTILQDSEEERKTLLNQYVIMMYAISLIFIVIVIAINNLMIPIFQVSAESGAGESGILGVSNPCMRCTGFQCLICGLFEGVSTFIFGIKDPSSIGAYYVSLFFFMSMIESFFSGLIAGQISDNSIISGLKHSLILTGITFGAFSVLLRLGMLGV
jgi:flagellar protein FlaJ